MGIFNMGSLDDWTQIACGELLTFELPAGGYRRVEFDVLSEEKVACRVLSAEDFWTVGVGDGLFTCRFSTAESVSLAFFGPEDAVVMIRTKVRTQVVRESDDVSYTTIEPRRVGPSDEVRRLMYLQQLNARRREDMLRAELAAMRGELAKKPEPDVVIEDDPPPADSEEVPDDGSAT